MQQNAGNHGGKPDVVYKITETKQICLKTMTPNVQPKVKAHRLGTEQNSVNVLGQLSQRPH